MLASRSKRLAELERRLSVTYAQATGKYEEALWAQFSDAELEAIVASAKRREHPGYVRTAEDQAIERRWNEAVEATVPLSLRWQGWAIEWGKTIKKYG